MGLKQRQGQTRLFEHINTIDISAYHILQTVYINMLEFFVKTLLLCAFIMLLCVFPLAKIRKNLITENELYGIFLGNYIYFTIYFLIISILLAIIDYLFLPLSIGTIFLIITSFLLFVAVFGYYNYRNPSITRTKIVLNKKAHIQSIKIAFVADFHLTNTSNIHLFRDMVEIINKQKTDIIFMGGDLLQNSHTKVKDDYSTVFSKLQSKYGVYTVLGNHEYFGNDIDDNMQYIQSLGITILRDEVLKIEEINFIGRDDIRRDYTVGQRKSLKKIYEDNTVSLDEPIIVIDHNPRKIAESIENKADIQLSAHTHAGQFFPFNILMSAVMKNAYGYKKIDNLHTVVTSGVGVGYWKTVGPWRMPYRVGTRSEVCIVEIDFIA